MNWFLAKLVFRIFCGNGNHPPQFEEQLRLIYADDELHAFHKARLSGEVDFTTEPQTPVDVKWKFIDVTELHPLTVLTDDAEVYSMIREEHDAEQYIRNIKKAATHLLQRSLHQFTGINSLIIGT